MIVNNLEKTMKKILSLFLFIIFLHAEEKSDGLWVLGLMSGTSLDGIDVALIKTDGEKVLEFGPAKTFLYPKSLKKHLQQIIHAPDSDKEKTIEMYVTFAHAKAIKKFLKLFNIQHVDLIGFHGQTIWHKPEEHSTRQLGDGQLLANLTGIKVINNFRENDMKHGGQGAPLIPLFHQTLLKEQQKPVAILNIGGVTNITYIDTKENLIAFDVGPGNALIDDWMFIRKKVFYDKDGMTAAQGKIHEKEASAFLKNMFFEKSPPKSLDRNSFHNALQDVATFSTEDGAATLTSFTAKAIRKARKFLPMSPKAWIICGGGRHNKTMVKMIKQELDEPIFTAEESGFMGDFIEAQGFAHFAVRSLKNLPLSLPSTTGVSTPVSGGTLYTPKSTSRY